MAERFIITGYSIRDTELSYSCSLEHFNVSIPFELDEARKKDYRINNGDLIGVRIPGYAIFILSSKKELNPANVEETKKLLQSMQDMASFFHENRIKPYSYLYYTSYVEDETLLQPTPDLITRIEAAKSGPHCITVPRPERSYIDGLAFEIKLSWIRVAASFYGGIYAKNKGGRLLSASIRLFDNNSVVKRKQCKRIVHDANTGKKLVAKVKDYQILLIAKTWKKDILSNDDVLVLLNQMATFFLTGEIKEYPQHLVFDSFRDISDEDFEEKLASKEIRDDSFIRPLIYVGIFVGIFIGIAIVVGLIISGLLVGLFGLIMLVAYADDLFARR